MRLLTQPHIFPGDARALRHRNGRRVGHWRFAGDGIRPAAVEGILSGILQSGYSTGYILAAVVARFVLPTWGWRPMFWLGGLPALLAFYISARVPESEAWKQHRAPSTVAVLKNRSDAVEKLSFISFC